MVIGIDVGGSTTKIVGIENGNVLSPQFITAADPVTSLFGAFGKYMYENSIRLDEISRVVLTGVGSAHINGNLYGLPTDKADEFVADALGARFGSRLENMVVVSMGTGTTFIRVNGDEIRHLGGLAIGGGTLQGLSSIIFKIPDVRKVVDMAMHGDASEVDLLISDIAKGDLPGLPSGVTASNFGKATADAAPENVAAGLVNMILQAIGSAANFVADNTGTRDFVLIGNLSVLPQCRPLFDKVERLYGIRFHIPEYPEFRTAIGAALSSMAGRSGNI